MKLKKWQRKQKAAIGLKDDEEVVKKLRDYEGYIQRKFTPEVFSEMVARLNKKQKEWVVRTGFGGLLQFQMQHYPHRLGYKIAESIDRKRCSLKLIDGNVEISPVIVSKVLGMLNGEKEIEFTSDQTEEDLWVKQFENKANGKITPRMVYNRMNRCEDLDRMFKLNFMVLMSNFLIETNANGYVNQEILHFKGNVDHCYEYKWCELLISRIKSSHRYWES
ncbi:hypothetical protein POM88_044945 [Heracleum sosnowskyi]|uniref:Uncharacterized protein n=1 Tax=Heracleum sosnowskyi TaxID=360622 RepID=A0AAD8H517_9APIA|nr:hypothetical protein POM88_044945 [Heracleum sosnowskyi]